MKVISHQKTVAAEPALVLIRGLTSLRDERAAVRFGGSGRACPCFVMNAPARFYEQARGLPLH